MRPQPPHSLFADINSPAFVPAEDMPEWIEATFLDPSSPFRKDVRAIVDAANQPPVIARGQIAMLAAPAS
ncbi:hypothetical protein GOB46_25525 [Sinorhizobium meliloti]|nr:hypothetical protein [Sinorhizobium meliloti]MDW9481400.1 hypothetical protein [Sinorhizobium meliloti]MDW9511202.1 hypothetical protein [Sinorhizobium meliloti]MDW9592207.1 hypothetical protein [Sinorhizobium meliloti]MDW9635472.1 hypothetical protein [Sinorhizobium meliloti]